MPDQKPHNLKHLRPEFRLLVIFNNLHIVFDEILLEQIVGDIRILYNTLEVSDNIFLMLAEHSIQYLFKFIIHVTVYYSLSEDIGLDVGETEAVSFEVYGLDYLDVFVADDGLNCAVGLVVYEVGDED